MGLQNLGLNGVAYHHTQRNQCCLEFCVIAQCDWSREKCKKAHPHLQNDESNHKKIEMTNKHIEEYQENAKCSVILFAPTISRKLSKP